MRGGRERKGRLGGWAAFGLLGLLLGPVAAAVERPVMLGVLVDTSGSIPRREQAARARLVSEVAHALPAGSQVALFAFDDAPRLLVPLTPKVDEVAAAAAGLRSGGRFTALNDAIFDAVKLLGTAPPGRRAVLLITDGLDENSALATEDGVQAAREQRIPVFSVGIGAVQERSLRRIAKLTGGEYFRPRSKPAAIASRILAVTPAEPAPARAAAAATLPAPLAQPQAEAAPVAAAAAPASAAAVAPSGPGKVLLIGLGAGLIVLAGVLGLVLWRRSQPSAAPAPEGTGASSLDEPTIITRLDGVGKADSTLVLTLKPLLHVTKGPNFGRFFEVSLDAATSVGRAPGNDIVLDDRAVSGQHCRIRPGENGGFELIDLRSTNGSYVNEKKVSREKLTAGDVIKLGETLLQFRMDHMKQ